MSKILQKKKLNVILSTLMHKLFLMFGCENAHGTQCLLHKSQNCRGTTFGMICMIMPGALESKSKQVYKLAREQNSLFFFKVSLPDEIDQST